MIDNIFSNHVSNEVIAGNLTTKISDHLPQVLIAPYIFSNRAANKTDIFEGNSSELNHEQFILDIIDVDWLEVLKLNMQNVDISINNFHEAVNTVLEKHAPYQKGENIP